MADCARMHFPARHRLVYLVNIDYSHFSHAFKKKFGITPNEFCKQNKLKNINIKNKNH